MNRRQFLRGGGARRWLRRRLTPRWWPAPATSQHGVRAPAARVLERLNFPWLVVTLAICALFALVISWLPGWLLATAWLVSALGLARLPSWSASSGVGLFSAHQFSIVTVWGRLTQQVRAVAGGIVIGVGLAVLFSVVLRFVASANIDIVSSARWSATAGLAIGLWRPSIVLALAALLGRLAGKLRKAVFRF